MGSQIEVAVCYLDGYVTVEMLWFYYHVLSPWISSVEIIEIIDRDR